MNKLLLVLITLVALDLHADGRCRDPFPQRLYQEANLALLRAIRESRTYFDSAEAIELHELIIQGFDEEAAEEIAKGRDPNRVANLAVGEYALTAAHVAAMMRNTYALSWLKKKKADLEKPARRGFTPAHFAALGPGRECLEFMRGLNVTMVAVNAYGANPEQLYALTHVSELKPFFYCDIGGIVTPFESGDFCMFTHAYFVDGIKQTPKKVIETWREEFAAREHPAAKDLLDRVQNFRSFCCRLYLRSLIPLALGVVLERENFKAHANEDFMPGDVVELYAGLFDPEKNSIAYGVFETKTDVVSGYLPFASDVGLPNVVFVQFFNRFGVSQGHFAMAIRPIRRHDMLVRERLSNEPARENMPEKDAMHLDEILRNTTLSQILESKKKGFDIVDIRNRALSKYLIDNANILLRLWASGKVSALEVNGFVAAHGKKSLLADTAVNQ